MYCSKQIGQEMIFDRETDLPAHRIIVWPAEGLSFGDICTDRRLIYVLAPAGIAAKSYIQYGTNSSIVNAEPGINDDGASVFLETEKSAMSWPLSFGTGEDRRGKTIERTLHSPFN